MNNDKALNVQCSIFNVQCSMFNVQCSMFNVQCSMFNVQCSMFNVQCSMFNVQCSMFNVQLSFLKESHPPETIPSATPVQAQGRERALAQWSRERRTALLRRCCC